MEQIITAMTEAVALVLPGLIWAIITILLGYVVGIAAKFILTKLISKMGVDDWFEEQNLLGAVGNKNVSEIAGTIIKWYIFFIFLKQAVEIVNLMTLNEVLGIWLFYAIQIIIAGVVVLAGMIIGRYARNAIEASGHSLGRVIGLVIELMVIYIAVVMGINVIDLPTQLLEMVFLIAFAGVVIAAALAIGISFGLALKEEARTIVKELKGTEKKK
ncbi:MAG: hypothetical protein HON47_05185 [Candidatus Diapherotrites archaeon]|jgi:hypothetical protein|uniref:Mechanosensitive ion channel n=1 Tax=Candidatus Iainarchaeum sp. TaxID=3101447 RepID=A0A8T5GFZ3_9ARCH|nr:hypothetical protein [Candidatus Diapherotrites archaeon]MBT7241148.1 hypothetical protein [Candidatus Diapherotrites archaeon]